MNKQIPQLTQLLSASLFVLILLLSCHPTAKNQYSESVMQQPSNVPAPSESRMLPKEAKDLPPDLDADGVDPEFNTEEYDRIYENPFLLAL